MLANCIKFAELERLFVKISQKRRFPGVLLGCRLEVRCTPRVIFVQAVGAQTAGDALTQITIDIFFAAFIRWRFNLL
jgi:hypothetical protein